MEHSAAMTTVLAVAFAALLSADPQAPSAAPAAAADPWAAFAPLLGRWVSDPDPKAGGATGWFTLEKDLQGKVLVRRNRAEYPALKDRPASTHDDLMVIYSEGARIRADYWDNEGHAIHYSVSFPEPTRCVFVSDAAPGAPRFRLTYAWSDPKVLGITFEIAAPNAPDQFKPYITARAHR